MDPVIADRVAQFIFFHGSWFSARRRRQYVMVKDLLIRILTSKIFQPIMTDIRQKCDSELTEALTKGDKRAFEELFVRYRKQSHHFVKARVFSDEVAQEIVQEVFTDIWDFRKERKIQHFSSYLFQALRYKTIKHINKLINHKKYWDHYRTFIPSQVEQTQQDLNYNLLVDALEAGLNNLPEKTQRVFRLNRLEGESLSDISKKLNLTEKAIQYHLTKSLKELKVHLKDHIISIAIALGLLQ